MNSSGPLQGKKVYILTLGCKVNQYESDAVYEGFFAAGALRGTEEDADICIVNTCSVTNIADRKSRQMLRKLRKANPDSLIIATGCYVQAAASRNTDIPDADLVVGNNRKKDLVRLTISALTGEPVTGNVIDIAHDPEFEDLRVRMPESHTRGYLKVQDGCNSFCTYCIIPYVRGRIRNQSLSSILEEAELLSSSGVKEIVLTGINLSSYGDIGEYSLADLICRIHSVPGIERIRLGSLEPRVLTEEFLERISPLSRICPHFHLSLQSCSDTVLKRMNRHYTSADIREIAARLRRYYDRPALTADIITGFPGETEEEYEETYRFLEELSLYEMHVFPFSRRQGTAADRMEGQLSEAVKKERVRKLLLMRDKQKASYEASFNDDPLSVLVEEIVNTPAGPCYRGHTERYLLVDIPIRLLSETQPDPSRINTILTGKWRAAGNR